MATKKDLTVEELTKACEEAKKSYETYMEQLKKAKQEEEDRRKAQLALEKENRKKEVDEAFDRFNELQKAYIRDYGSLTIMTDVDDSIFSNPFFHSFF